MNETIKGFIKMVVYVLLACTMIYGMLICVDRTAEAKSRYEQEHSCKYDYNDFCYTENERPWLF